MHNKRTIKPFIDKPVILYYRWNGSQNIITGIVKKSHYYVMFRKIESQNLIKIRYNQIDGIGLMPDIPESYEMKVNKLQKQAEDHLIKSEYKEAIKFYDEILSIIRPNTQKWNRFKSAKLDCENIINSRIEDSISDGSMEMRDKLEDIGNGKD